MSLREALRPWFAAANAFSHSLSSRRSRFTDCSVELIVAVAVVVAQVEVAICCFSSRYVHEKFFFLEANKVLSDAFRDIYEAREDASRLEAGKTCDKVRITLRLNLVVVYMF